MGYRLQVVRRPVTPDLTRSERRSWQLHRTLSRQLDGPTVATQPNVPVTGFTNWDGTDETLTGLVPVGIYYYRIVATDDAGNTAQSGESRPIQIRAGLPTLALPNGSVIHIRIDLSHL